MADGFPYDSIAAAVAGSTLSGALVRAFLGRSLRSLDDVVSKINDIRTDIAKISVRLDNSDKNHDLIHRLDRKVAALESKHDNSVKREGATRRSPN